MLHWIDGQAATFSQSTTAEGAGTIFFRSMNIALPNVKKTVPSVGSVLPIG
jgi:hypothetical protein